MHATSRYCLRCWSPLRMERPPLFERPRCPKCLLPFDPDNPETFSSVPHWLRWQQWLPGLVAALASGLIAYVVIWTYGLMDSALFIAVPLSMGMMLGIMVRARIWLTLFLSIFAVTTVSCGVTVMGLHGLFCGATLAVISLPPALLGALLGLGLQAALRKSTGKPHNKRFTLIIAALPYVVWAAEELHSAEQQIAEVRTEMVFPAGPGPTWHSIVFYEQVEHEPPWLLRLALPRPVGTEGSKVAAGDVQRCIYQKGHLIKQITDLVEPERLAFRVIEQHLHFERDVTLLDGCFTLGPLADGQTRVVLTTRYLRHLRPAWMWEWMERKIVHALHGHVLEGMRRRLEGGVPKPYPPSQEIELAARK
jgi:hypothetical protein